MLLGKTSFSEQTFVNIHCARKTVKGACSRHGLASIENKFSLINQHDDYAKRAEEFTQYTIAVIGKHTLEDIWVEE